MIEFAVEDYYDCIDEIKEHINAHDEEVGPFDEPELDPDYDSYEALADTNQLVCFTAREDSKLVGYAMFLLVHHHYYATVLVGQSDLIYVVPEYRGVMSKHFIEYCEEQLWANYGVDGISISMHTKRDFSGMLQSMNYKKTAIVCSKYVGDS